MQDSYINPRKRVTYIFEVIDGGDEPAFKVTSEDDPTNPIVGRPSSSVAQIALNRIAVCSPSMNPLGGLLCVVTVSRTLKDICEMACTATLMST